VAEEVNIRITEAAGGRLCVASGDGEKIFTLIAEALKEGRKVHLSFQNVSSLTSAFLNGAVGQLYGMFPEELIRKSLRVSDMAPEDLALLKRVVDTAKIYFKDPERLAIIQKGILGEDADE
jgi:hypothetical protein